MRTYKSSGVIIGALLGLGSPLGGLFLRMLFSRHFSRVWVHAELSHNFFFYLYMLLTVPIVFAGFGFFFGYLMDKISSQKEALARSNIILEHQSMTDDITGLYNHRHILEEVDKELERAKRYRRILSGIMLDIDRFKEVNDLYGHLTGDAVISEMAEIIRQSIRKIDVAGRFGGDEFLLILPEADPGAALSVAKRLQLQVRQHRFKTIRDYLLLTVSIGIFSLQDTKDYEKQIFIEKMDMALLKAKNLGKDRIHSE